MVRSFLKSLSCGMLSFALAIQPVVLSTYSATASAATLNLKNASIRSLISTVSKATKRNFIIDPRVNGNVTVLISEDLPSDALYQVFLSILRVHGFIVVEGEHVSKILPANQSKNASAYVSDQFQESVVTAVVPIQYINAQQIIPVLRPFVSPTSFLSAYAPTNMLIVHDTQANLQRLKEIVKQVDQPLNSGYEIIQINYASASEMVKIINTFISKSKNTPASKQVKIAADPRTNRLVISADKDQVLRIRALVADLDIADKQGNTNVVYLRYSDAKKLLPILQGIINAQTSATKGAKKTTSSNGLNIQADEVTNSIIITAPQDLANHVESIKSVIRRLDIRRAQVLIEAIIAEVNTDNASNLGFQWVSNTNNAVGLVNFNNQIPSLAASALSGAAPTSFPLGSSLLLGEVSSNLRGWGGIVNALRSNGNANILSTPALVTLDNQEASILVGQEVPFISNTQLSASNTNPFQNFERRDVGITLKVKPQINEGDVIQLAISQEISSVLPSAQAVDTVTSKRTLNTTVLVQDGNTLVLGGLIDEQETENEQRIPLLGDIPFLGALFRYTSSQKIKRNLMIFIRPKILRNELDVNEVTTGKYNLIRSYQLQMREQGNLDSSGTPILDDLSALPDTLSTNDVPSTSKTVETTQQKNEPKPELKVKPATESKSKPSSESKPAQTKADEKALKSSAHDQEATIPIQALVPVSFDNIETATP